MAARLWSTYRSGLDAQTELLKSLSQLERDPDVLNDASPLLLALKHIKPPQLQEQNLLVRAVQCALRSPMSSKFAPAAWGTALRAANTANDSATALQLWSWAEKQKLRDTTTNVRNCNTLLSALARGGDYAGCMRQFNTMRQSAVADAVSWTTVISMALKVRNKPEALRLYREALAELPLLQQDSAFAAWECRCI